MQCRLRLLCKRLTKGPAVQKQARGAGVSGVLCALSSLLSFVSRAHFTSGAGGLGGVGWETVGPRIICASLDLYIGVEARDACWLCGGVGVCTEGYGDAEFAGPAPLLYRDG